MDYHIFKSAVNSVLSPYCGGVNRPPYLNIATDYPELDAITRAYHDIRNEFDALCESNCPLPRYHDIDRGEAVISAQSEQSWSVCMLEILGHRLEVNRKRFPKTCAAIDQVPGVIQAFFSVLAPRKSVPEHEGPYLGYLRYHLGLRVPKQDPPRLVVSGVSYQWKEGEAVLFDDSHPHEVINDSPESRAVLIVDVRRPLPLLPAMLNHATTFVARHTYGRAVARKARQFSERAA